MQFRTRAFVGITVAVAGLGMTPTVADADAAPPADTVTFVTPTEGAAVGGSHQTLVLQAPAGTVLGNISCNWMNNYPTVAWSPQAADGTITGVADLSQCRTGKDLLTLEYTTPTTSSVAGVDVNVVNPGKLFSIASTTTSFTPNGDQITDTVAIQGEGDLNIEKTATITVLDAKNHKVRTLTPNFFDHEGDFPFGTVVGYLEAQYVATWDGRTTSGKIAAPGKYTIKVSTGSAGHPGTSKSVTVTLKPSKKISNATQIDLSKVASVTTFDHPVTTGTTFDENVIIQPSKADYTWRVLDAHGKQVAGMQWPVEHHLHPYNQSTSWNGTNSDGTKVPNGHYTMVLTTTEGTVTKLPLVVRGS